MFVSQRQTVSTEGTRQAGQQKLFKVARQAICTKAAKYPTALPHGFLQMIQSQHETRVLRNNRRQIGEGILP